MIEDMHKTLVEWASGLENYKSMSRTELANGYCDADEANDELKRSQYYAALMLEYWYMVYYLEEKNKSLNFELEDFASWVSESLDVAFKYRRWRDPNNPLSKDPRGFEKVVNRCISSTVARWYAYFNKNKRKINYSNVAYSLEESYEIFGDSAHAYMQYGDVVEAPDATCDIVQLYLNKGKIIEAIIIDGITHQDTFAESKNIQITQNDEGEEVKTVKQNIGFKKSLLLKHLKDLDEDFLTYFEHTYDVDIVKLEKEVNKLAKSSKQVVYKHINKTLESVKSNKEVINLVCS